MQQVLVYSDSLTWGIIPGTRKRLDFVERWPGVLEQGLVSQGFRVRVIENCLNGRRTVWDDPFKAGRNGADGLAQVIEMHSPLALVIIMLGNNDFQRTHDNNAWLSAQGVASLIEIIRKAPIEPGMPVPDILVVAPPMIEAPKGVMANKFAGAEARSQGLVNELETISAQLRVGFFDANQVTGSSVVDGIHLDKNQHLALGEALVVKVAQDLKV